MENYFLGFNDIELKFIGTGPLTNIGEFILLLLFFAFL